jgi:hypothetical protein
LDMMLSPCWLGGRQRGESLAVRVDFVDTRTSLVLA